MALAVNAFLPLSFRVPERAPSSSSARLSPPDSRLAMGRPVPHDPERARPIFTPLPSLVSRVRMRMRMRRRRACQARSQLQHPSIHVPRFARVCEWCARACAVKSSGAAPVHQGPQFMHLGVCTPKPPRPLGRWIAPSPAGSHDSGISVSTARPSRHLHPDLLRGALFSFGTRSVSRPRRPGCRDTPSGLRIHPPLFRLQQPAPTFHGHASLQPTRSLTTPLTSVGCGSGMILLVPGLLHFCSLHQLDPICRQHPPTTHQPLTKATVADAPPFRFQPLRSSAAVPCPARPSHALHTAPSPAILLEGRGGVASAAPYRGESGATLVCSNVLRRVKPRPIKA